MDQGSLCAGSMLLAVLLRTRADGRRLLFLRGIRRSAVMLHVLIEHKKALAEVIDKRIGDRPDRHLAVALDVVLPAEGKQLQQLFRAQHQLCQQRRDDIIRQNVAYNDLRNEAQELLPGRHVVTKQEVLA